MTKVHFPRKRSAPVATWRQRQWLMFGCATFAGCVWLATTRGAEQNDSGWAIAAPSPIAKGGKSDDFRQQIILRHVLDQSQQPLLKPSPTAKAQTITDPGHAGTRFATRPDGTNGWRPAGSLNQPAAAQAAPNPAVTNALPPLPALKAPAANQTYVEAGCNGPAAPTNGAKQQHFVLTAPSLADAYGNPPASSETKVTDEETCQGNVAEEINPVGDEPNGEIADDGEVAIEDKSDQDVTVDADDSAETMETAPAAAQPGTNSTVRQVVPVVEEVPPPPLTKQLLGLRTRVRSVLSGYYRKQLNSRDNDPWEVMHGMLAYGVHSRIRQGSPRGDAITSVGWLCYNKPCKGQTLMYVNPQGEVRAKYGVGLQGHLGQLLAMLAQCHVSADYPIHIGTNEFTVRDLIEAEKKTCYPKSELTFKLIALQYYDDLDDKWVNDQGMEWDFPKLMREELAQPIRGAACGGTHRLSGLSLAVKTRIRRGEPLDGEYGQAAEFVKKYQQYAFRLQNRDGSLSTSWFRGTGDDDDINRRIKTTGHMLEWLCYSLTDEELRDPRTVRAVTYLANLMYSNYDNEWEVGPVSHATHALLLYDERVFRPFDKEGAVAAYRPTPHMASGNQPHPTKR